MPDEIPPDSGSVTIAGQPILIDYQCQLRKFLADRLPPEDILFARWQVGAVRPNPFACDNAPDYIDSPYPPLPSLSIGEIQWPSGASRYARALYAVDYPTMREIAKLAWGWEPPTELIDPEGDPDNPDNKRETMPTDVPESWGTSFYEVEIVIRGIDSQQFRASMLVLRPYRVTGAGADCWLLPLVDVRWKMGHKAFEPLPYKPENMAALVQSIATAAGATIAAESASITGEPDKRLWKAEQPAVSLLDAACLSSGLRVVRDPVGTLRALSAATSETRRNSRLSSDWQILSGGKRGKTELPSTVRVHCRKEGGDKFEVKSSAVSGGMSPGGTSLAVWSSWRSSTGNVTETNAFAAQIAGSVSAWGNCGGQYCMAGPINYIPSGFDDYMSILLEEPEPEKYTFRTTIRELPGVFLPRAILIGGEDDECCGSESEDHFLFTLSEYMAGGGALGAIRTMDDLTLVEASATVKNTLNHFSHLKNGDRGICVKVNGVYYAVHPEAPGESGATSGHVFTLDGKLDEPHGSTASATIIRSGETGIANGATITVVNTGDKVGYTGAVGWAVKIGLQYWVVEIDQYPLQSLVVFDDDTHTFSGAGTRQGKIEDQKTISVSSWEAMTPYPFSFVPSAATIHNPHNLLALANDSGIVAWNDSYEDVENSIYGRFELIEVFPFTKRRLQFRLTADIDTMLAAVVEDFEIIQTREFTAGQVAEPSPKYLYDDMKLIRYGRTGDLGECEYSYREENWQITAFRAKSTSVIVKTPTGGIPARSGTALGSASCDVQKATGGVLSSNAESLTVYNPWPIVIPEYFPITAVEEAVTGLWVAQFPGVLDVRYVLDTALEQTLDGISYLNIETPEDCS